VRPRRLSRGDWVAAIGGVVMLVALFLPWYSADGQDLSAWQSMAVDDVILAIAAMLAIAAAFVVAVPRLSSVSVAATSLAVLPAAVGLVVTIYRLLSPAPPFDVSLGVGAWLGLAATIAIAVGAWVGASDEGPARRTQKAERRAAAEALARTEVLNLTPDGDPGGAKPVRG
jgi:drug/metabolite transporter (DMT)-like permease